MTALFNAPQFRPLVRAACVVLGLVMLAGCVVAPARPYYYRPAPVLYVR